MTVQNALERRRVSMVGYMAGQLARQGSELHDCSGGMTRSTLVTKAECLATDTLRTAAG